MLDASVVIAKGSSQRGATLSPSVPEVIIDGSGAGASVVIAPGSGAVLTATVDNAYVPSAWAAATSPQAVAAGERRAFKQAGPNQAGVSWTFS